MPLSNALARIEAWLKLNRPEYWPKLQPGATDAQLVEFATTFGVDLPAGFHALYSWRNGQSINASDSFDGNRMFMALADITSTKNSLDGMIGTEFEDPGFWRREWIPFLDDGAGNYTVVDTTAEGRGRLLYFWHDEDRRRVMHPSVEAWADEVADSMYDGSYEAH